jgi:DNA-binding CsgD family transcriptional regulator
MTDMLPVDDVRAITRLLAEVVDLPAADPLDPAARKRHLIAGLAKLVDADVWLWNQGRGVPPTDTPMVVSVLAGGYESDRQRDTHLLGMTDAEYDAKCQQRLGDVCGWDACRHVTRTRDQLVDDATWYGLTAYREKFLAAGLDQCMISLYLTAPTAWSGLGLWRRTGRPAFTARDRCVVHVVTGEVGWLHRDGLDVPAADHVVALSPRLRQVLLLLLSGNSRKEIAGHLGISPHTVADYMKALHQHFAVRSRGELLSRFMVGGGVERTAKALASDVQADGVGPTPVIRRRRAE